MKNTYHGSYRIEEGCYRACNLLTAVYLHHPSLLAPGPGPVFLPRSGRPVPWWMPFGSSETESWPGELGGLWPVDKKAKLKKIEQSLSKGVAKLQCKLPESKWLNLSTICIYLLCWIGQAFCLQRGLVLGGKPVCKGGYLCFSITEPETSHNRWESWSCAVLPAFLEEQQANRTSGSHVIDTIQNQWTNMDKPNII